MKIRDLRPGDEAVITGYEDYNTKYRKQLLSLGLTRGTRFTLTRIAPMGDPVEINVRDFALFLRKGEADVIEIKKG